MKFRQLTVVLVSLLIINSMFSSVNLVKQTNAQTTTPDVYVGVDMGYATTVAGAESLIDQVSDYTNFFILGASALTMNVSSLNETLQHAYDKGLYFMSFPPSLGISQALLNRSQAWIDYAKANWGDHLKGFMYPYEDEPGGHTLDNNGQYRPNMNITKDTPLVDAEKQYINSIWFQDVTRAKSLWNIPLFTSDYSLYWFDYLGGYDGLFAEFGWQKNTTFNVALCRGAATVQNKQWGVIITYQYNSPPYMESGADLYKDLVLAYDNGAKYITVLDTNVNWTAGLLTQEHFQALQQFWQYIHETPRKSAQISERVAYELPQGYAYGFRGPSDNIWGVRPVDMMAYTISESVYIMLQQYGSKLDIIYNESKPEWNFGYSKTVLWNDPTAVASAWPSFWPGITQNGTTPPTNQTPTSESPSSPDKAQIFMSEGYICASVLAIAVACAGLVFILRKRRIQPTAVHG